MNPQNPFVLRAQVACAAHELPLAPEDERWFGDGLDDAVRAARARRPPAAARRARCTGRGERPPARRGRAAHAARRSSTGSIDRDEDRVDRHRRRRARVRGRASGRGVPPPGPAVPRRRARPARPRRACCDAYDDADEYTQAAHRDRHRDRRRRRGAPSSARRRCTSARSRSATRSSRTNASRSRPTA